MDQQLRRQRMESTQTEQLKEERIKRNEDGVRKLWDNIKYPNVYIIVVQKGEERERSVENLFKEIIAENFPKLRGKKNSLPGPESTDSSK